LFRDFQDFIAGAREDFDSGVHEDFDDASISPGSYAFSNVLLGFFEIVEVARELRSSLLAGVNCVSRKRSAVESVRSTRLELFGD
jgi:hypothetical protein